MPIAPFRYFSEAVRTVQDDGTVQIDYAWYAARPAAIGSQVLVRAYAHEIEIRDLKTLDLIRRHSRAAKGELKLPEDERVFNPSRQTHRILARAEAIGPAAQALCRSLFDRRGREAQRSMWGIVGLAARYPAWILERACAAASASNPSYKRVRTLADQLPAQTAMQLDPAQAELPLDSPALTQTHELIRELEDYAAFFKRCVGTEVATVSDE